ncbi:MAG TPA: dockerin type I repeat-containing protein [Armatimonadota bacterium]
MQRNPTLNRCAPVLLAFFAVATPARCGPTAVGGSVDGTWTLAGSPYVCSTTDLTVDSGHSLSIDPGVVVQFDTNRRMQVAGTLTALGAAGSPIIFTSTAPSPVAGAWKQLQFLNTAAAALDHVAVQWAGQGSVAAVQIGTASAPSGPLTVTLTNSAIASCAGFGLAIATDSLARHTVTISGTSIHGAGKGGIDIQSALLTDVVSITGNDLTANSGPAVQVKSQALPAFNSTASAFSGNLPGDVFSLPAFQTVSQNVTLQHDLTVLPGSGGGPTVASNVTLAVQPGVTMRFDANQTLNVYGSLSAAGSAVGPVTFTGVSPLAGAWNGIWLHAFATGSLSRAQVNGAGAQGGPGILADGATLSVADSDFGNLQWHAVDFEDTDTQTHTLSVTRCTFHNVSSGDTGNPAAGVRIGLANPGDVAVLSGNTFTSVDRAISLAPAALPVFNAGPNAVAGNSPDDTVWVDGGSIPDGAAIWERIQAAADLIVPVVATVTFEPGSGLRMGSGAACSVYGRLNVSGQPGSVVTLDGTGGLAGAWGGLQFQPGSTGTLTSAALSNGGANASAELNVNGAGVTAVGCAFLNGSGPGIKLSGSVAVTVKGSLITGNAGNGVADNASGPRTIGGALVDGNDLVANGAFADSAMNDWQEAVGNYWGADSGPYHPTLNPLGLGGTVSDHIHFLPFSGAPRTLPVALLDLLTGPASGIIPISGTAASALLANWTLEYGPGDPPSSYHVFAQGTANVASGLIANWNTAGLNSRLRYSVRLTVQDVLGRVAQSVVVTKSPYGDISGNGEVDLPDAVLAARFARGRGVPTAGQLQTGDVRPADKPDGAITVADVIAILKTVAGLYGNLP